ncbi:MAG: DUF5107 domain-containing protein [Verrucomicrobiota bacterium]
MTSVSAIRQTQSIPTYPLGVPEKNPLFFEKRVYQGSCGKVYPVPFIDKVFDAPQAQDYDAVQLENDFVRLTILPEIGGRIFAGQDKQNQDYDFFYRQDEIKPALVGLAGPWISGGVEFNWPQHHRPGTYMPADVHIEAEKDGARTVWLSEHDPLNRLKGMHGIRLKPDSSVIELKARLFNRTPFAQTFLWWANIAAEVHDQYQSFFPPDVHYVADHAVRAQSSFPLAENDYYGVDYASRPGGNDLSRYSNIPVPTSYMVCDTRYGFFGGYDFATEGGFIHVANPHISPGKKQWTWGNHEFGWAWDRELTDRAGRTGRPAPYVELMAGVYTDNQPDFTYLHPYETKTFSQYWWPYQKIGPVQNANEDVAVRLMPGAKRKLDIGVVASKTLPGARLILRCCARDRTLLDERVLVSPEQPWQNQDIDFEGENLCSLYLRLEDEMGRLLIDYRPPDLSTLQRDRAVATEPPLPDDIETLEELVLTAEHLEQYRHPTRYPEAYWQEALKRDPQDTRSNIAWGRTKLKQGLLDDAAQHFETAIKRLTHRHPNPCTGEAHYYLGLVRRFQNRTTEAYHAFYKSTWNYEWRSAAYYELATLDSRRRNYTQALEHCDAALETNAQNNKAIILKAILLKQLGQDASQLLTDLLDTDPLDHWARYESGDMEGFLAKSRNDAQTILDIAYDYADAGLTERACALLELHHEHSTHPVAVPNPMERSLLTRYALAWLREDSDLLAKARAASPDYCFPSRLHDQLCLEWALRQTGEDRNAAFGLGNYYYDRKRHDDAIRVWEQSEPFPTVCRNLGLAYWNIRSDGDAARKAYQQALQLDSRDARLLAEYDQLCAKLGDLPADRLTFLLEHREVVAERDDSTVALAELYNQTGQPDQALHLLLNRRFHPWEGGEGKVLRQYTTARLQLAQQHLKEGDMETAWEQVSQAMDAPENLGEAYHLLQAKADVNYWKGKVLRASGREAEAVESFTESAEEAGDFQAMAVTEYSELSYYRGLSMIELDRTADAQKLFEDIQTFAESKLQEPARIDYFATSLPLLLVFEDNLDEIQQTEMTHLIQLAQSGLDQLTSLSTTA